jgi:hypothetical protein
MSEGDTLAPRVSNGIMRRAVARNADDVVERIVAIGGGSRRFGGRLGKAPVGPGMLAPRPELPLAMPNYPRSPRRFERGSHHPIRRTWGKVSFWRGGRAVEGARLESVCTHRVPWVRIPPSPLPPLSGRRTLYLAATTHIVSVTKRRRGARAVEGARLESACTQKVPWVRIPPSPWKELSALGRR